MKCRIDRFPLCFIKNCNCNFKLSIFYVHRQTVNPLDLRDVLRIC